MKEDFKECPLCHGVMEKPRPYEASMDAQTVFFCFSCHFCEREKPYES